jgi:hypothetical protein
MKIAVFSDVTLCNSCMSRRFGGEYRLHYQGDRNRRVLRLLFPANVVPSSPIFVTLMMEAILSSETSVLTRATQRNITESGILHDWKLFG